MDITFLCFFHIIFINSIFIAIDYLILKSISKTAVSFLPIVIAGLISLFLAAYLANLTIDYYFHDQWFGFRNGVVRKSVYVTGALIFTIYTIIIEIPFYIFATKDKNFVAALKSSAITNLVTNLAIGLLYLFTKSYYSHPE